MEPEISVNFLLDFVTLESFGLSWSLSGSFNHA